MSAVKKLGIAYAWLVGEQWFYLPTRELAPRHAIEVHCYEVDGEIVLHEDYGGAGRFIRGAKQPAPE